MKSGVLRNPLLIPAIALAGAIGVALAPAMAAAQDRSSPAQPSQDAGAPAAAPKPTEADSAGSVGGVIVQAPRPPSKLEDIPPDKRAAFDQEAAKDEAWKRYRRSTPPLAAGTLGMASDYPGLQSLLPQPDETTPAPGPIPLR